MDISNLIAAAALVFSIYNYYKNKQREKTNKEWEIYKEKVRQKESVEQSFHTNNNNRITLIPHFHLSLDKDIYVKNIDNKEVLILPISLINLGKESATNIQLVQMREGYGLNSYFKADGLQEEIHFLYGYLDKQYAFTGNYINFSVRCNKHDDVHNVNFKIKYNDLVGRTYEQEFRFQYWFSQMKEFSMNHVSNLPVCIDDSDRTNDNIVPK